MKMYAGAAAAARQYLEADRGRANDYYLAEGTGIAWRFAAGDGRVMELATRAGDGYEAWVAGLDPSTGMPRGRLRTDERAVRFVEVVVSGPKSWSLAAALHPNIAVAYDADAGPMESPPKAGSQSVVHLPPQGVSALAEHLKTRSPALPTARLFVRRDGRVLRAHHVHAAWSRARRAADLPHVHLHDLRHSGLTLAAQSGATLAEVMRRAATRRPAGR